MKIGRSLGIQAFVTLLVAIAACASPKGLPFPDTINFGGKGLTKATAWNRGGMSAVVYVPPEQTLPLASLQVGVIISADHATGAALHRWNAEQALRSGNMHAFDSSSDEESCRVGATIGEAKGTRTYLTLQVCRTGVARAICVESDEYLDGDTFTSCIGSRGCETVCTERWLARRAALDELVARMMTIR